jgi:molybdopterin-binding protein
LPAVSTFSSSQVAELLGVSPDTVRRWCDEGRLKATRRAGGHRQISGKELARYLRSQDDAYEPDPMFGQSARNRLTGIVTDVQRDKLTAIVEIHVGRHRIVSLMTREAADELGLAPGELATAVVKSTNVIVEVLPT